MEGTPGNTSGSLLGALLQDVVFVRTRHGAAGTTLPEEFDLFKDESMGTQKFFALLVPVLVTLDTGGVLFVDELDSSLHPLLTRKVVELFHSREHNRKGAQLVFTAQDVTLLDPDLLRRDQIWFVEKDAGGASRFYSLYDFAEKRSVRSTEQFLRRYLAGMYGAVPQFGRLLEELGSMADDDGAAA